MAPKTTKASGRKKRIGNDSRDSSDSANATPAEKPVSLKPLTFEEAVKGLMRVRREKKND